MSVQIDTDQARHVAGNVREAVRCIEVVTGLLNMVDLHADAFDLTTPIRSRAVELVEEAGGTASILDALADQLEAIDNGALPRTIGQMDRDLRAQLDALEASLDDDAGPTSGDELRRFLEFKAFDGREPPRAPIVLLDQRAWLAAHVTGQVLSRLDGEDAALYWLTLDPEARFAVIQVQPAAVSAHVVAGDLGLGATERMTLLVQPVPLGAKPPGGNGTDWLGQPIPAVVDQGPGVIIRSDPTSVGGGIAIIPDNWVCTAIQSWSLIPSRPDVSAGGAIATGRAVWATGKTVLSAGATPAKLLTPGGWAATFADLTLCRFEMGSGDPISSNMVWDETQGKMVYETSRSDVSPNIRPGGATLSPDRERRDLDRWNDEHQGGDWLPYPGFPAYPESAPGAD